MDAPLPHPALERPADPRRPAPRQRYVQQRFLQPPRLRRQRHVRAGDEAGYAWRAVAENIAWGYSDVTAVVQGWKDSPATVRI